MNSMPRRIALATILCLAVTALSGCGVIDYFFQQTPDDTARELYEAGQSSMEEHKYSDAAEYFTKLKDRYPFSPITPQAEISLGDALYLGERYEEAAAAYKEFESLHPRHERIPYVLFQVGMSYYKQFRSLDRPPTAVQEAEEYFRRVAASYPDSEYAPKATEYAANCRRKLAEHEVYIADFYWRSGRYLSAWTRYRSVMEEFPDVPEIVEYARNRSDLAYLEYQRVRTEGERERREGSWKEWFNWL